MYEENAVSIICTHKMVGDHDNGFVPKGSKDGLKHFFFCLGIKINRWFVKNDNGAILKKNAGNAMALSA